MTGIPARVMGNGEGWTTLILTDSESRLIRDALDSAADDFPPSMVVPNYPAAALRAFNSGIQRATDRIAAEFAAEQKKRKDAKK